jgi:hypothetical protein
MKGPGKALSGERRARWVNPDRKNPVNKRMELRGDARRAVRITIMGKHRRNSLGGMASLKVV